MTGAAWSDDEIEILRATYADDTISKPLQRASELLPHRGKPAISFRASTQGFAAARLERHGKVSIRGTDAAVGRPRLTDEQRAANKLLTAEQKAAKRAAKKAEALARREERAKAIAARQSAAKRAKTAAAAKVKAVALATKAATIAAAALAEADRLAEVAGIAPLIVAGRPGLAQNVPKRAEKALPVPVFAGACDIGDREVIRRRLVHTINALSAELRRTGDDVAAAVKLIAARDFKREGLLFSIPPDDIAPGASVPSATLRGIAV